MKGKEEGKDKGMMKGVFGSDGSDWRKGRE